MELKIITDPDLIDRKDWSDFIRANSRGTIFQSPEMFDLFKETDKFDPVIVAAYDSDDTLAGVLLGVVIKEMKGPFSYLSARTVVYGGPVLRDSLPVHQKTPTPEQTDTRTQEHPETLSQILKSLVSQVRHKCIFIQFRNFTDMTPYQGVFKKYGFSYRERLNFIVDTLSSVKEPQKKKSPNGKLSTFNSQRSTSHVFLQCNANRQRQIKKGLATGAEVVEAQTLVQVKEFYNILYDLYRHKIRKPLPDWSFFENFFRQAEQGRLGKIFFVRFRGQIIGGILCPITPDKVIYEWYVCGLDREFRQAYPSILATWSALDYAERNGIASFDFMGVGIPGKAYGVREFKSKFGGMMVNYGRFARINNRLFYAFSEAGYNLLAFLKKI